MPDMLVKLYELPDLAPELAAQKTSGVDIRRALNPERHLVLDWIEGRALEKLRALGYID